MSQSVGKGLLLYVVLTTRELSPVSYPWRFDREESYEIR